MAFMTPYVVNEAAHSARLFRRQLQQASSGAAGVARPGDLKVSALNVPGAGFRVAPGGVLIPSRDAGADRETYGVENDSEITVTDVVGTGSQAGRTDMVIVEIMDPEMSAVTYPIPPDPLEAPYTQIRVVQNVPATAKTVADVPALKNVTAYAIGLIKWPKSTGTITEAMITDLREVAVPRRSEVVFARPRIAEDNGADMYLRRSLADGGEVFPGGAGIPNQFEVDVPEWATHMIIDAKWMTISYKAGADPHGRYWIEFGDEYRPHTWPNGRQYEFTTQEFAFNAPKTNDIRTDHWLLMDTRKVATKLRGKKITICFKAGLQGSPGPDAVYMNALGGLGCRITFSEGLQDANVL